MADSVTAAVGEEVRRAATFDPGASTGLFVGVSSFEDPHIPTVPFAVDDAVDLAHLFALELEVLHPKRMVLALAGEPKKPETKERLNRLLELGAERVKARNADLYRHLGDRARAAGPEGLFLLSVATHGVSDQGGDFLLAADSLPGRLRLTASVNELFDEVARSPAPRRLVLLDACRERLTEGTRGLAAAPMAKSFHDAISSASGQAVLSGATLGGFAYDDLKRGNGVFTAAILDGLRGAAAADARGLITVGTLAEFVQQQVADWVRRHRPPGAEKSLGIGRRTEGAADALPLALNLDLSRARDRYRDRRAAALATLRQHLGTILTGTLHDRIVGLLPEEPPVNEEVEALLEEIEALDGSHRTQRSLRDYMREVYGKPVAQAVPVPGVSASPAPPADVPPPRQTVSGKPARERVAVAPGSGRPKKKRVKKSLASRLLLAAALLVVLLTGFFMVLGYQYGKLEKAKRGSDGLSSSDPVSEVATNPPPSGSDLKAGTGWQGPIGMRFHYVPAGTNIIGSPKDEAGRYDWEAPSHEVRVTRGFWLAETEVTQAQWGELVAETRSRFNTCGGDCPVEMVSWFEAVTFANLLSDREGLDRCYLPLGCTGDPEAAAYSCEWVRFFGIDCEGYRLPTEAEWEVAARAGTRTALYTGGLTLRGERDGPELDPIAWYGGNSGVEYERGFDCSSWQEKHSDSSLCGTHPVGQKQANPWGLHDMLGNVWEWTWDSWHEDIPAVPALDPLGPAQGTDRVIRGGSWVSSARYVRVAFRSRREPSYRNYDLGFRLARSWSSSYPKPEAE